MRATVDGAPRGPVFVDRHERNGADAHGPEPLIGRNGEQILRHA